MYRKLVIYYLLLVAIYGNCIEKTKAVENIIRRLSSSLDLTLRGERKYLNSK